MQAETVASERRLRSRHRGFEGGGALTNRHVVERLGECGPVGVGDGPRGKLIERLARNLAKAVGVDRVQRDADNTTAGDESGSREVKQARQQLAPGQVAGGANQDDDLRMLGADSGRYSCQNEPLGLGDLSASVARTWLSMQALRHDASARGGY